jgi:hypothetical protein
MKLNPPDVPRKPMLKNALRVIIFLSTATAMAAGWAAGHFIAKYW